MMNIKIFLINSFHKLYYTKKLIRNNFVIGSEYIFGVIIILNLEFGINKKLLFKKTIVNSAAKSAQFFVVFL